MDRPWQERYWEKVDRRGPDECWPWTGATTSAGYGHLKVNGRMVSAHRLALQLAGRPPGPDLFVLHSCDTPLCVNPQHLREGTHAENMSDKKRRNRQSRLRGETNGWAKLTEADVRRVYVLRAEGLSQSKIAAALGVSQPQVSKILRGRRWAHVPTTSAADGLVSAEKVLDGSGAGAYSEVWRRH